ncbi:peptide/nickel transport system substrate-binding protein [Arthrobacter alpinus]|uniref:Peptide/nickel transport system substrate-binding protein n=1 Tax=Arthrobacter alpinus TaxID=656366 RepID=A0A1H5F1F7_9MICC|nr:ABC transporter substrate-binding protein [Arthrobacter alpinus]SED97114.1 peptide/nickel transport system substrate-binding protein [Arthrobacter alpinus]
MPHPADSLCAVPSSTVPRRQVLLRAVSLTAVVLLGATACTVTPDPAPGTTAAATTASTIANATFSFGTGADPSGLDPALVSDTESYRVTRQVLEGLLTIDPVTGAPAPSLATTWTELNDGLSYSFTLRPNVKFHDGTAFDAAAVCTNFERWYAFKPATRGDGSASMFKQVFRGFKDDSANSLYESCTVDGDLKVTLNLKMRLTGFLEALTLPAFAISSPTALKAGTADVLDQTFSANKVSKYALHPVGTGPFTFTQAKPGSVTMTANADYWGSKGQIETLNFKTYEQPETRIAALEDGSIDGFDPVTPDNLDKLIKSGQQVLQRDPFSVMYLSLNQSIPALADQKVREAIAAAIDKSTIVNNYFIAGTATTAQFIPPKLSGFNNAVAGIPYDPQKAKTLLAASSYKGEELKFYYPTNAARTYLPSPEKVYAQIATELTAAGLNIKPVPVPWGEGYVSAVTSSGDHALSLLGWNGSYADPDNFVGALFGAPNAQLSMNDPQLVSKITRARSMPNGPDRVAAYQAISEQLAQTVPAVPIAFPISAIALSDRVASYPLSPVLNEVFNMVKLTPSTG